AGGIVAEGSGIERTETDIVGAAALGLDCLLDAVSGNTDDQGAARDPLRGRKRQVLLSKMHTGGAGENRDIRAVIDDQHRAALAAEPSDRARRLEQRAR